MLTNEKLFDKLYDPAKVAFDAAYAPYSGYQVGAAIMTPDGKVFTGCNVENASYGGTVCAERVAIGKAVSEGYREFSAVLVITDEPEPWAPCGFCRQVMTEFFNRDAQVIMTNLQKKSRTTTVDLLCPDMLRPEQVKRG